MRLIDAVCKAGCDSGFCGVECDEVLALRNMPSAQPYDYSDGYVDGFKQGQKDAQPERTGKWIKLDMHAHLADHKCTACGQECYVPTCMGEPLYAYCPNCGAKMKVK